MFFLDEKFRVKIFRRVCQHWDFGTSFCLMKIFFELHAQREARSINAEPFFVADAAANRRSPIERNLSSIYDAYPRFKETRCHVSAKVRYLEHNDEISFSGGTKRRPRTCRSAVRGFGVTQSQLAVIAAQRRRHEGDDLPSVTAASMRSKQGETLRALRLALIANGISSVAQQARVLCLPRSTAWFVLQSNHKWRGLNAAQVVRMLRSQWLPDDARRIVLRYVRERAAGAYGHTEVMRQKFLLRLEQLGWAPVAEHPADRSGDQSRRPSLVTNP